MAEKEDEISLVDVYLKLRDTVRFLWSKKISILIAGALGGVIGLTYAYFKPIEFESRLTFIVDQKGVSKGLGAFSGIASSFGLGAGDGGLYDNQANIMNYLKSRKVIENSLISRIPGTKTSFAERFVKEYGWEEDWMKDSRLQKMDFSLDKPREKYSLSEDSVLNCIYTFLLDERMLEISLPDEEGSILEIDFNSFDDTISRYFPETLLSIVSKNYTHTKTKLSRENVELLQHQTDSVRNALNQSLVDAANSSDQIFGLNPALNVRRVPTTKEQIDIESSRVLLGELIKNLELAKVQLKDQTPLIEVIDEPRFPLKQSKNSKISFMLYFGIISSIIFSLILLARKFISGIIEKSKKSF